MYLIKGMCQIEMATNKQCTNQFIQWNDSPIVTWTVPKASFNLLPPANNGINFAPISGGKLIIHASFCTIGKR